MKLFKVVLLFVSAVAALGGGLAAAATRPPLTLAPQVDVSRMYGGWYIIATIPNSFERGMVAPYDVYSARPDGGVREDFYAQRGGFGAKRRHFVVHDWVRPGSHGAHWRVQILWPINLPFLVLYVDPDYRYALFGEENRAVGWIYSRTPVVDDAAYAALLTHFAAEGYDTSRFRRIVQRPDQIGKPGFWSDGIKTAPR
jgi:apolipoprotein D and lipocalin family protein